MAQPKNYKNNIRFYPPNHFVFYPVMFELFTFAVWQAVTKESDRMLWVFITIMTAMLIWVSYMLRQHYALTLQNRLVLMELRYRYFMVTGKRLEPLEEQLTEGQLFALRFAPDDELEALAERVLNESLSADTIKRSIKHWRADNRRV